MTPTTTETERNGTRSHWEYRVTLMIGVRGTYLRPVISIGHMLKVVVGVAFITSRTDDMRV